MDELVGSPITMISDIVQETTDESQWDSQIQTFRFEPLRRLAELIVTRKRSGENWKEFGELRREVADLRGSVAMLQAEKAQREQEILSIIGSIADHTHDFPIEAVAEAGSRMQAMDRSECPKQIGFVFSAVADELKARTAGEKSANERAGALNDELASLKRQLERIRDNSILDLISGMESRLLAGRAPGAGPGGSDRPSEIDDLEQQMVLVETKHNMLEDILRCIEKTLRHVDGRSIDHGDAAAVGWDIQRRLLDVEAVGSAVATSRPRSGSESVVERSITLDDSGDRMAFLEDQIQDLTDELEQRGEAISRCEAKMAQRRSVICQLQDEVRMKQSQLEAAQKRALDEGKQLRIAQQMADRDCKAIESDLAGISDVLSQIDGEKRLSDDAGEIASSIRRRIETLSFTPSVESMSEFSEKVAKLSTVLVGQEARIGDLQAIIREEFLTHVTELEAAQGKAVEAEQARSALDEQFRLIERALAVVDNDGIPEDADIMAVAASIQRRLLQLEPSRPLSRVQDDQAMSIIATASAITESDARTNFLERQLREAYDRLAHVGGRVEDDERRLAAQNKLLVWLQEAKALSDRESAEDHHRLLQQLREEAQKLRESEVGRSLIEGGVHDIRQMLSVIDGDSAADSPDGASAVSDIERRVMKLEVLSDAGQLDDVSEVLKQSAETADPAERIRFLEQQVTELEVKLTRMAVRQEILEEQKTQQVEQLLVVQEAAREARSDACARERELLKHGQKMEDCLQLAVAEKQQANHNLLCLEQFVSVIDGGGAPEVPTGCSAIGEVLGRLLRLEASAWGGSLIDASAIQAQVDSITDPKEAIRLLKDELTRCTQANRELSAQLQKKCEDLVVGREDPSGHDAMNQVHEAQTQQQQYDQSARELEESIRMIDRCLGAIDGQGHDDGTAGSVIAESIVIRLAGVEKQGTGQARIDALEGAIEAMREIVAADGESLQRETRWDACRICGAAEASIRTLRDGNCTQRSRIEALESAMKSIRSTIVGGDETISVDPDSDVFIISDTVSDLRHRYAAIRSHLSALASSVHSLRCLVFSESSGPLGAPDLLSGTLPSFDGSVPGGVFGGLVEVDDISSAFSSLRAENDVKADRVVELESALRAIRFGVLGIGRSDELVASTVVNDVVSAVSDLHAARAEGRLGNISLQSGLQALRSSMISTADKHPNSDEADALSYDVAQVSSTIGSLGDEDNVQQSRIAELEAAFMFLRSSILRDDDGGPVNCAADVGRISSVVLARRLRAPRRREF
jgi:hypothetical protein